jgi:hypothetical protein
VVSTLEARAVRDARDVVAAMHEVAVRESAPALADDELHGVLVRLPGNRAVETVREQFTPAVRRAELLRFASLQGRESAAQHDQLIRLHREAVTEVDDAPGEVALEVVHGYPVRVVGALRADERGRDGELRARLGEEGAEPAGPAVGAAVVDDHGGRRDGAQRGVGVPAHVCGQVAGDRRGELVGADAGCFGHAPTVRAPRPGGSRAGVSPGGRVHPDRVLAIGELSRPTHLSVRTLRRYRDAGLLEPATVDDATGCRCSTADQIPAAQVIHRLRELDVPLPDVQRILLPAPRS